jgi:hypothetical protein
MSITFEPLEVTTGALNAKLPTVRCYARQVAMAPNTGELYAKLPTVKLDNNYTAGSLYARLPTPGLFATQQSGQGKLHARLPTARCLASQADLTPPTLAFLSTALPLLQLTATAKSTTIGTLNAQLPTPGLFGTQIAAQGKLHAQLPSVSLLGRQIVPETGNYVLLAQTPGVMWAYGAVTTNVMQDGVSFSDTALGRLTAYLLDTVVLRSDLASSAQATVTFADRLVLEDALRVALQALMQDGLTLADAMSGATHAVMRLLDRLVLTGAVSTQQQAINVITDALALSDVLKGFEIAIVGDEARFSEAYSLALAARAALIDQLVLADTLDNTISLFAAISDTLVLDDSLTSSAQMFALIRDGVVFHSRLRINGETYIGHVVNVANKAFSTYTGLPFNSMAKIGRTYFGTGPSGLYRLFEGDDADGEPIIAEVRSGMFKMGTNRLKRMPSVYLGLTADGRTVLKVVTTDAKTGAKHEWWYERSGRPLSGSFRNDRVKLGRGLRGEYWQWALVNADGADFSLDVVELFPLILESRL